MKIRVQNYSNVNLILLKFNSNDRDFFRLIFLSKIAIENVYSSREWALVERKLSVLKPVNDNIFVFVQPCTNNNYRIIFLPDKNFASGRGSKKNGVFKVPI